MATPKSKSTFNFQLLQIRCISAGSAEPTPVPCQVRPWLNKALDDMKDSSVFQVPSTDVWAGWTVLASTDAHQPLRVLLDSLAQAAQLSIAIKADPNFDPAQADHRLTLLNTAETKLQDS